MARKYRKKTGSYLWTLVLLSFVAGFLSALVLVKFWGLEVVLTPEEKPLARHVPEATRPPERPPERKIPEKVETKEYSRVAIVIDDMGQDLGRLDGLLQVDAPITISVLPHLKFSRQVADRAHKSGREVLLHLPMEPKDPGVNNPGKGALLTAMNEADVRVVLEGDLEEVPYAIGVNNHMGSRGTEDEVLMRAVLDVVRKKELFFLDSRTTSRSVGSRLAKEMGVKNADRQVFLDNKRDRMYIKGQLDQLVRIARKRGSAIAIGHPYPETIEVLKQNVPALEEQGIRVVKLSELVE